MGKSMKKSAVDAAPAVVPPTKSAKKGKREAEKVIDKQILKKQKVDKNSKQVLRKHKTEIKTQRKKPTKKAESSSSDDASSSDSDKAQKVKKPGLLVKQPPKESSSDESSSDEERAVPPTKPSKAASKNETVAAPVKKVKHAVASDPSSSESDSDEESPVKVDVPSNKQFNSVSKNGTVAAPKNAKTAGGTDSSSSSGSDSDEEVLASKKIPASTTNKDKLAASRRKAESSDSSESESDSDEDVKANPSKKLPASTTKVSLASKAIVESSDSSESESDSDEDFESNYSSSDSDSEEKKKAAAKVSAVAHKPGIMPKQKETAGSLSESDSSDDEDTDKSAAVAAAKLQSSKKEESSESSEDDSDEDDKDNKEDGDSGDDSSEGSDEEPQREKPKQGSDVEMLDAVSPKTDVKQGHSKSGKKDPKTLSTPQDHSSGSKTLFVGNLSFSIEQADIENFFKSAGEVADIRLASLPEGGFKGFGHVEFATVEAAQKALELNGKDLLGRAVRLDLARERGSDTPYSGKESNSYQNRGRDQGQTAFVRGFDKSLGEDEIRNALEEHFGSCGELSRVSIPKDYETGEVKGFAYIGFDDAASLNKALELNGSELGGYSIIVDEARPRGESHDSSSRGRGGRFGGRDSGGRFGARDSGGRFGGRRGGGRGRGGFNKQSAGTASAGKKTTFDD